MIKYNIEKKKKKNKTKQNKTKQNKTKQNKIKITTKDMKAKLKKIENIKNKEKQKQKKKKKKEATILPDSRYASQFHHGRTERSESRYRG